MVSGATNPLAAQAAIEVPTKKTEQCSRLRHTRNVCVGSGEIAPACGNAQAFFLAQGNGAAHDCNVVARVLLARQDREIGYSLCVQTSHAIQFQQAFACERAVTASERHRDQRFAGAQFLGLFHPAGFDHLLESHLAGCIIALIFGDLVLPLCALQSFVGRKFFREGKVSEDILRFFDIALRVSLVGVDHETRSLAPDLRVVTAAIGFANGADIRALIHAALGYQTACAGVGRYAGIFDPLYLGNARSQNDFWPGVALTGDDNRRFGRDGGLRLRLFAGFGSCFRSSLDGRFLWSGIAKQSTKREESRNQQTRLPI